MQTLIDGAVIVQGNLEAEGRLKSRPGVVPAALAEGYPWTKENPSEPLSPYSDHNSYTDTWIPRASQSLVLNQVIPMQPQKYNEDGPMGGQPLDPSPEAYVPGKA